MRSYILLAIIFFALLSGCKKEDYNVPDDFLFYVQTFENEASLRGRTIDIEKEGLKVEFADFTGKDYVGLTNYENPVRIQIDKHYWNSAPDPYREFVLFHELGHAFLGIHEHRNDTLPNGDWKSIMRGPPANGDEHKVDYVNHRDYYLDELFLDHVEHPAWSFRSAIIELAATDTAFGLLPVNAKKSKNLTIKNKGNKQVIINSIQATDGFSSNFTGSIQPNDSINVSLTFSPTEQKQYSGDVEIYHSILNDTEIKPLDFKLTGEGSTSHATGKWFDITPFPGAARYEAASFTINGNGFVCLGRTYSNTVTQEIWEYNSSGQWVKKNDFPGPSRNYPIGFSINGKGYLGLGRMKNDFWEYNYSTDSWTRMSDFPGQGRIMSVYFSTSEKGYLGLGLGYNSATHFNDFWEYDPVSDEWTQLPDYPGEANIYAAAFTINDRIFVGTGCDGWTAAGHANSDFWEFDASANQWIRRSDFAGGKTAFAISFSVNNYGYLGGGSKEDGTGTDHSFWEYDPVNDKWSKKAYMPDFSYGGAYFGADNKGYFGIGFMTSPYFWEFDPNQ